MKARVKFNKASLDKKLLLVEQTVEERVKDQMVDIAQFATSRSPVDTGAYVTSFSMKHSYSSGRGRTSKGKPRNQSPDAKRQEGLSQLLSDIETLKPLENDLIVLSNSSPHAKSVEYGNEVDKRWGKPGYAVFTQIKDKFR